jgi:hemoglobin-like flavoprotein
MTPEQIKLVQTSFGSVKPIAPQAAALFYDRLFEIAPDVRALFPADLTEQKQRLMSMIAIAVDNLHQVEQIVPAVQALGRRHATYGVRAAHYQSVGEALIWTLRKGFGAVFTDGVKEAWIGAYSTLATVMSEAAANTQPSAGSRNAADTCWAGGIDTLVSGPGFCTRGLG